MAAHTGLPVGTQQKLVNFPSHSYLDHLSTVEKEWYGHKLQVLGTCDLYIAPVAVFQLLKTARSQPELHPDDIKMHPVENPSPYNAARMKAYSSADSYMYFWSWWVKKNCFFLFQIFDGLIDSM